MSKAYHHVKNFSFKEVMNLVCYGSKYPETLTQTQRITRLYRATLRMQNQQILEAMYGDVHLFNDELQRTSADFYELMNINQSYSDATTEQKRRFELLVKKWEQWHEDVYEPQNFVEECRPYAPSSGRYFTFNDSFLSFDPFGYYKPRLLSDKVAAKDLPFFEDYPMNDTRWNIAETFPDDFNDEYVEREERQNQKQRSE